MQDTGYRTHDAEYRMNAEYRIQFTRYDIHETGIRVDESGSRNDSKYRIQELVYLDQDT